MSENERRYEAMRNFKPRPSREEAMRDLAEDAPMTDLPTLKAKSGAMERILAAAKDLPGVEIPDEVQ